MSKSNQHRMDMEDDELEGVLFPSYYVQSPSTTISIENSTARNTSYSELPALFPSSNHHHSTTLSPSSSHGSNNIEKISTNNNIATAFEDLQRHDQNEEKRLITIDRSSLNDDDDGYYYYESQGWWRYLSFSYSSSSAWILLQVSWRFLVSLGIGLLVFYMATKPPTPHISIKVYIYIYILHCIGI